MSRGQSQTVTGKVKKNTVEIGIVKCQPKIVKANSIALSTIKDGVPNFAVGRKNNV